MILGPMFIYWFQICHNNLDLHYEAPPWSCSVQPLLESLKGELHSKYLQLISVFTS